jgi:hypothetical protein
MDRSSPAEFIFYPQILHINCATTPCAGMPKLSYYWSRHYMWCCRHNANSWHQNLSPGQPPYLRTSHINSTTTRYLGMPKHCLYAHLNTFYCTSKFGTSMINGSPPAAFSICKLRISIAPQCYMLARRNFAGMLIIIPSMVHPNLEPVWSTVRPLWHFPPANFAHQLLRHNATCWHAEILPICSP